MLKYRPDIDGLRAIAVGSVVLYHLDESLVTGGFVGVDIFFVISGYLITKLIYGELSSSGTFSFKNFYLRRVRRLFPALLATFLFCFVCSYFLFPPAYLTEFGQSLIAALFSVSNIFFWSVAGYFDSESSLKPLLHTWSLSVEEQFYLIWPAVLVGLFSLNKQRLIPIFVLSMGLVSWLLNEVVFSQQASISAWFGTQDNQSVLNVPSTVFYWLPFRVFEFAIGAILVWFTAPFKHRQYSAEALFAIGLAMVTISIVFFDDAMEFPSSAALLPCLGAALMILSGPNHRLSPLVSNKLMVGIGLISYSLYLIHWPLIVFYQYWVGREFTEFECVALVAVGIGVAYLMYRFIEQPFRRSKERTSENPTPNRSFLLATLALVLVVVSLSANAITSKGWLWRYPDDVVAQLSYKQGDYSEYFWANIRHYQRDFSNTGQSKVLVIGDSMAAGLMNVLVAGGAHEEIDLASVLVGDNCKTFFGLSEQQYQGIYSGAKEICQREHSRVLSQRELFDNADTIILATYWWEQHHLKYVSQTVEYLKTITDAKIKVLGLKVQQSNGIYFLSKHAFEPNISKLRTPPNPQALHVNRQLKQRAQASGNFTYFDLMNLFCNQQGCQRVTKDGYVIVFDATHFSEQGAHFAAQKLKQQDWYKTLLQPRTE